MKTTSILKYHLLLLTDKVIFKRAIRVAILVGLLLNLINCYSALVNQSWENINLWGVLLTFLVPYFVSTYSSFIAQKRIEPGNISNLDADLKCTGCNKSEFHVHIGQTIEECPQCGKNTRWKIRKLFSFNMRNNHLLKSLALFAKHNPQPLIRIDSNGNILNVNPASMRFFKDDNMIGKNISKYFPAIHNIDLEQLIDNDEVYEEILSADNEYYKFLFKGVSLIGNIHIYGNHITEIKLAEEKIKEQANELREANNEILAINSNLEKTVHQRTAKIQNQHNQIIKYAFKNAHEVRAPLARILGLSYLWTKEKLSEKNAYEFMEKINHEANVLDKTVRDLNIILQDEVDHLDEMINKKVLKSEYSFA